MTPDEVPTDAGMGSEAVQSSSVGLGLVQSRVFQEGYGPQSLGPAYRPGNFDRPNRLSSVKPVYLWPQDSGRFSEVIFVIKIQCVASIW